MTDPFWRQIGDYHYLTTVGSMTVEIYGTPEQGYSFLIDGETTGTTTSSKSRAMAMALKEARAFLKFRIQKYEDVIGVINGILE